MSGPNQPNQNFDPLRTFLFGAPIRNTDSAEEKLKRWARAPGTTEQDKIDRAVRMIGQAIEADEKLSKLDIEVFPKGSFHNRTNIPTDSDVDVGVLATNYYFNIYPEGTSKSDFNFVDSTYLYEHFRPMLRGQFKINSDPKM